MDNEKKRTQLSFSIAFTQLLIFTSVLFNMEEGWCVVISIPSKVISAEKDEFSLDVHIEVNPNEKVSGIQFDLVVPSVLEVVSIQAGESAQNAGKMVSFNRLWRGRHRTIIVGLNREPMRTGTLVHIRLRRAQASITGTQSIQLENVVVADPDGNSVNLKAVPGEIRIEGVGVVNKSGGISSNDVVVEKDIAGKQRDDKEHKPSPYLEWILVLGMLLLTCLIGGLTYWYLSSRENRKEKKIKRKRRR